MTKKSILKLTYKDYKENGMSGLLAQEGSAYDLNIKLERANANSYANDFVQVKTLGSYD